MSESLPPSALFSHSLAKASQAYNLPTIDDETQGLIRSSLNDLKTLQNRILGLSLFSPNESLEDISTRNLVFLSVPYVAGELQNRLKATERPRRLLVLDQSRKLYQAFVSTLGQYNIVPADERELHEKSPTSIVAPGKRRELKIKQYQKEKELRTKIEVVQKRRGQKPDDSGSSDYDLISSLLPSTQSTTSSAEVEDDEEDSRTDEILREATVLLLRMLYGQAQGHLESLRQEEELLKLAPPAPEDLPVPEDSRTREQQTQEDMWRLDPPIASGGPDGKGPLMDSSGKPLRPFTILSSEAAARSRLQAQVFRPDHNLPTMTIDEYLDIEKQRGNILTGGGPASQNAPTSKEQLAIEAEMEGTTKGEEKSEQKRQQEEKWAQYTDANARGAGNTMNRG
ncbi:hypothetical protein BDN72DRAFT_830796 [Pluteus cervinus]|uniref:Uncharacterized protein n=1 Tax=Pluteus cervinus TaxID=181527 RepID=A0ACD3BDZ3_9AGAR|nr:hypothetical protein BDN72DRAFT_830796 [Pluteus cervinus]